jgi:hypothetical protein
VIALRNRRRLGLLNGTRGTVTGIDTTSRSIDVRLDSGATVHVPSWYLDEGFMAHGYAFTIHKAQGMTCDVAFLVGDDHLYAEAGYTGLSRARLENRLYVVDPQPDGELAHGADAEPVDPVSALTMAMSRSRAKQLALDLDADAPEIAALVERPAGELRDERDRLAARLDRDAEPLRAASAQVAAEHYDVRQQLRAVDRGAPERERLVARLASLDARRREIAAATAQWADAHRDDHSHLAARPGACRTGAGRAARAAVHSPGRYEADQGPRPDRPLARARWSDALRRRVLYEADYGVDLAERRPTSGRQARDRRLAVQAAERAAGKTVRREP